MAAIIPMKDFVVFSVSIQEVVLVYSKTLENNSFSLF